MHTRSFFWWNTGQRNPFYCCPGWLDCRWVKGNLTGNSPVTHWHHIQKERSSHYGNAASGCKHSHAACSRSNHHHLLSLPELSRWLGFRLHAGHNSLSHHLFKQAQNWSIWTRPLWGWQSDNRTGSLTAGLAVWQQNTCSRHIHYAATSGLSHEPWPLHQVQNWSIRTQPLWGWQSDNRTGSLTTGLAVWQQDICSRHIHYTTTSSLSPEPRPLWAFIKFRTGRSELSHCGAGSLTTGLAVWQQDICSRHIHYTTTSSLSSEPQPLGDFISSEFWSIRTQPLWRLAVRQQDWQSDNRSGSLTIGLAVWQQNVCTKHIHYTTTSSLSSGHGDSLCQRKLDLSAGLMNLCGFDESTPVYLLPYVSLWVWWD